jgi:hypothetical protein
MVSRFPKWIAIIIVVTLAIGLAYLAWPQIDPSLNVYDIDVPIEGDPDDCVGTVRFAVLGDFGEAGQPEADVAELVDSWKVDFIVTVGDNNYPNGSAATIDENIGQYYHDYIYPYVGEYGEGATENRFFPALGNHDWRTSSLQPYFDYFSLPGNERYYDVTFGPVHLFIVDSDPMEPDGRSVDSIQAQWLQKQMEASTAPWKIVSLHHAPYSSGSKHGDEAMMQWPYAGWGATTVLAGHEHVYERLQVDNIVYFVNGLGGRKKIYPFGPHKDESAVRFNQEYGAMLVNADESCINFSFIDRTNELIDSYTMAYGSQLSVVD